MVDQHYHLQRGYTEADWLGAQSDPILDTRELGLITDTGQYVIGDGATAFSGLTKYSGDLSGVSISGGAVYTDASTDPNDADGEIGDFHLRRDTGVLTGPKIASETTLRGSDGFDQAGGSGQARWARRFLKDTSNFTVTHVSVGFASTTSATEAKAYLLNDSKAIIAQTDPFTCAANTVSEDVPLLSSVELVSGNHYWLAIKQSTGSGVSFKAGTNSFPDTGLTDPSSGDTYAFWASDTEDFTDATTGDGVTDLKYYFVLHNIDGTTWTSADTRVLGDVVQADLADFVSSGVVHTDAAADPVDGTGAVGDFHLRRDTGTLTGPKVVVEEVERSGETRTGSAGSSGFSQALRFRCVSDFTVTTVDGYLGDIDGSPATVKFHILDASRNTIGSTAPFELTSADDWTGIRQDLLSPVDLAAGYEYWVAYEADELVGSDNSDGAFWPDAALATPSGGESLVRWTSATSDFTSTPDNSYSGNYWRVDLVNSQGSTWTGADELLIASRLLDVEDEAGATYDVVADDTGKVKRFTAECTIALVDGLPVGTVIELMAFHANGITVQDNGTSTVHGGGTVAQYGTCSALCVATDTWVVTGAA